MNLAKHHCVVLSAAVAGFLASAHPAAAWECIARSHSSSGWGSSPSRVAAMELALRKCAVHAAAGETCRVRRCSH